MAKTIKSNAKISAKVKKADETEVKKSATKKTKPEVVEIEVQEEKKSAKKETKEFYKTEIGDYQGRPTIRLYNKEGEEYPFSFGVAKAKLIVKYFSDIKKFVEGLEK